MNGLPVVRFSDAANTGLTFPRPMQDDFTMLCVYRSSKGSGTGTQFYQGAGVINGEVPRVTDDFATSLYADGTLLAGR